MKFEEEGVGQLLLFPHNGCEYLNSSVEEKGTHGK